MFNNTEPWIRKPMVGRIKVVSSNVWAGQYISRDMGEKRHGMTCDKYENALRVRIAPSDDDRVVLQCYNANASGFEWIAIVAGWADQQWGKGSSQWATLSFTTDPSLVKGPLIAAQNVEGSARWKWHLGYDGTLRAVWEELNSSVGNGYQLSWTVEVKTKRIYAISDRNAYLSRYYPNNCNDTEEAAVRLVFEPETEASK